MGKKYNVSGELFDATLKFVNCLEKIDNTKSIKLFSKDFTFLDGTINKYIRFNNVFLTFFRDLEPQAFDTFLKGLGKIDFSPAKNDSMVLTWLNDKKFGFFHKPINRIEPNIKKLLSNPSLFQRFKYIFRMILIYRDTYSYEEYQRDLPDIYLNRLSDVAIPIIPFSVIEKYCSWGKSKREECECFMALDPSYDEIIKKVFK